MFERYTEKARRVIFFARYEAAQFGSPLIETEHLLLGIVRDDKVLTRRFLGTSALDEIRKEIEQNTTVREKTSTSTDLPLSNESKRVLAYGAEEADRLNSRHIGTEHMFLGLLREEKSFAAQLLSERKLEIQKVREALVAQPHESAPPPRERAVKSGADVSANLVPVKPLCPLIGRTAELDRILHILGCRNGKNPVLVGELGVGKRTIVGGLAQRISEGYVPSFLIEKTVLELDLPPWDAIGSAWFDKFHSALPRAAQAGAILVVDELHTPIDGIFGRNSSHLQEILKRAIVSGQLQCISVATPAGYAKSVADHGWLEDCFQPVHVHPGTEADTADVLRGIKNIYEDFHGVTYVDEAPTAAIACAKVFLPHRHFPGKAVDLIDEAGSAAKVRGAEEPIEIVEAKKRLRIIINHMEKTISNHEFGRARSLSEQEKIEREGLRFLAEKHKPHETAPISITIDDIEAVVSRWTGVSLDVIRKARPTEGKPMPPQA